MRGGCRRYSPRQCDLPLLVDAPAGPKYERVFRGIETRFGRFRCLHAAFAFAFGLTTFPLRVQKLPSDQEVGRSEENSMP